MLHGRIQARFRIRAQFAAQAVEPLQLKTREPAPGCHSLELMSTCTCKWSAELPADAELEALPAVRVLLAQRVRQVDFQPPERVGRNHNTRADRHATVARQRL